jgi:L-fuconate dehydratase
MPLTIRSLTVRDIRFPTSRNLDGSDAVNVDPDYSCAYVVLHTDDPGGLEGHGLTFTTGRGTEVVVAAVNALAPRVVGQSVEIIAADMAGFWRHVTGDTQIRWLGPDKGASHLAAAAIVNAVWDLYAKQQRKPLWKLLADMTAEQVVACVDFRYITDALTPDEALSMLKSVEAGKAQREAEIRKGGFPAYTTSAGWLGYDDDKLRRLCRHALGQGFNHLKLKVGRDVDDDVRRCSIARDAIGPDRTLMVDANQYWEVEQAIEHMKVLARFRPWWIEEPTSPDDVLGHATIAKALNPLGIGVATGEMCQNRILFKQFMQAGAMQFCQIDSCRLGGVNEVLAVYLLAKKFGVPVCPHAGGVGLCEYVQHLAVWDFIACGASLQNRVLEYVDHLHEHFIDPVRVQSGRYLVPTEPGYSAAIKPASLDEHEFPIGRVWRVDDEKGATETQRHRGGI